MRMLSLFLPLWPLLELVALIALGGRWGLGWTLLYLVGSVFAGLAVLRLAPFAGVATVAEGMRRGELPASAVLETALIGLAGVLLLVPGPVSDLVAVALLLPPLRRRLAARLGAGSLAFRTGAMGSMGAWPPPASGPDVYDGEFTDVSEVGAVEPPPALPGTPSDRPQG